MMRAVQRGAERISEADRTVGAKYFGASVPRREDPRLLRGEGRFVDDMKLPGMLHAAFVRSPHAHARITAIRADAAARLGARVFTFADLARFMKPLPLFGAVPPGLAARVDVTMKQAPQFALCRDVARYVGEIVAMVLAESRALAEDAAELVEVDYEPLGVVTDVVAGMEPGAPLIHAEVPGQYRRPFPGGLRGCRARPRRGRRAGARALSRPALCRHADGDAGRRRAVGSARPAASPPGTARRSSTSSRRGSWPPSGCPPTRSGSSRPTWAAASGPRPMAIRRTC